MRVTINSNVAKPPLSILKKLLLGMGVGGLVCCILFGIATIVLVGILAYFGHQGAGGLPSSITPILTGVATITGVCSCGGGLGALIASLAYCYGTQRESAVISQMTEENRLKEEARLIPIPTESKKTFDVLFKKMNTPSADPEDNENILKETSPPKSKRFSENTSNYDPSFKLVSQNTKNPVQNAAFRITEEQEKKEFKL